MTRLPSRWSFAETLRSLARYGVVGISQNLVSYGSMQVLVALGLAGWQAIGIVYPAASIASYLGNKLWSFQGRPRSDRQFARYVALYAAVYVLSTVLTWLLERGGLPPWAATLVTMTLSAALLFAGLNLWVFPLRRGEEQQGL